MAIKASGTSLTELYGVGPILACGLIGYSVTSAVSPTASLRLLQRHGTDRVLLGGPSRAPVLTRGNRKLNHAIHMVAITQIRNPGTQGTDLLRAQGGRGQDQEGSHPLAQAPGQQRRLPPAAPRRPIGVREDTQGRLLACVTGSTPCAAGSSAKSLPNP